MYLVSLSCHNEQITENEFIYIRSINPLHAIVTRPHKESCITSRTIKSFKVNIVILYTTTAAHAHPVAITIIPLLKPGTDTPLRYSEPPCGTRVYHLPKQVRLHSNVEAFSLLQILHRYRRGRKRAPNFDDAGLQGPRQHRYLLDQPVGRRHVQHRHARVYLGRRHVHRQMRKPTQAHPRLFIS